MKKIANVLHHTHWDNEWYFTEEDSLVQLNFHFKEMIEAFEKEEINYFLLDGQTAVLEDYFSLHPEDIHKVEELIAAKKLYVGPLLAQLDCFISSGEAVINNMRLGMQYANKHGGTSTVAYLPDSFGQSQDFPKIFNGFGVKDFIFRRGMGDEFDLPLDFIWKSNDGSELIVNTQNAGYGFATDPFVNGTLINDSGLDYDGKSVYAQMNKLCEESTLENEFLLPIGNDQTPVINNFMSRMHEYNNESSEFSFVEVTIEEYMKKVRNNMPNLKTYEGEFLNCQYHRVHKSLFSARADIKLLQDKLERMLAFEVQPLMVILDDIGLVYDHNLIDKIWNLLIRSQTHSSATNTDKTNELILKRTQKAYNLAESLKVYLIRKVIISSTNSSKIVFFNTLPLTRTIDMEIDVYSKNKNFVLELDNNKIDFVVVDQQKVYSSTIRKDELLMEKDKYFYKTRVSLSIEDVAGLSYKFINIIDTKEEMINTSTLGETIENKFYRIAFMDGKVNIFNKVTKQSYMDVLYFEESGDEGDNYDYSYPDNDMINKFNLLNAKIIESYSNNSTSKIVVKGTFVVPKDLEERALQKCSETNEYTIMIKLKNNDPVIKFSGAINNTAENHRVRIVFKTPINAEKSIAGTQFGYVSRDVYSPLMEVWKKEKWLEEPTAIEPLLNHVSLNNDEEVVTIFSGGIKEYEIIGKEYSDIALTIFRSVGHLGLPDLNRRPGRASGLAEKIIESPLSQMKMENTFSFGVNFYNEYNCNKIMNDYAIFATNVSYYQNQSLDRVVFPISYFHTNPLKNHVEPHKKLFELKNSNISYSTVEKALDGNYVIRLCNFENTDQCAGILEINYDYKKIVKCDMLGNNLEEITNELGKFRAGEIVNVKIIRR